MMKFKIESKPSPLRQLDNIKQLKNVLKPIKADQEGMFVEKLREHPQLLKEALLKDFKISEYEYLDLECHIYFDIPLISYVSLNGSLNIQLLEFIDDMGKTLNDKKELSKFLQGLERIPSTISPTKIELTQKIEGVKSSFVYEGTS